ncbi:MAG: LysR family transcriptional regulator [Thiothrix sp.]|nr:LysR family transcriptional regulator [Thiothrix sp.]HPQ95517.1 LysR family transcriptional regulator [Thiolinea sp.]
MLNQLEALKIFCSAAETLQFKETAHRLAISPPVVTRVMAELEDYLGEPLFQRNTRQIVLTDFGARFLPQAWQLLQDSERLFAGARNRMRDEMIGLVRITVPDMPGEAAALRELLDAVQAYPQLLLDWRKDTVFLNVVESQIDIGVRMGVPVDNRFIIRHLGLVREKIVAAPGLVERLGVPNDLADLARNYPLSVVIDRNSGRPNLWHINEHIQFSVNKPVFIAGDMYAARQSALAGQSFAQLLEWVCEPDIASGELVEVLSDIPKMQWPVYLYRPQRVVTPVRVLEVFELLVGIFGKHFKPK